jgi:prepilin-type N-terminal cleavage/methylation domain-containing protein
MPAHRPPGRPAMTLVEVLVVVAIVALLIGLLLPAAQRVREAANQTACRNNLRQIGIALHAFHESRGRLPPGLLAELDTPPEEGEINSFPGWGWAAHLLPHLGQGPLSEQIVWEQSVGAPENVGVRTQVVKTFVCPSDLNTGLFVVWSEYNAKLAQAATNSYAACFGFGGPIGEVADSGTGVFYRNSKTRFEDIRDGTATTLAVGERAALFCQSPWAGAITTGTVRTSMTAPTYFAGIEESPVMTLARTAPGPLNHSYSSPYDFFTPHPAAGLFLFADGSVRSLAKHLPAPLWEAVGTRDGGESATGID